MAADDELSQLRAKIKAVERLCSDAERRARMAERKTSIRITSGLVEAEDLRSVLR